MENEEEYARLLDCCETTRKEWAKHWQCDEEVQDVEEKPWKNEELRSAEEALPRLKECHLEEVSRLYKAKTVDRHTYRAPHFPMHSCCTGVFLRVVRVYSRTLTSMHLHGSSHEAHCLRYA